MQSLYSAFILDAGSPRSLAECFTYSRSQPIWGTDIIATGAHTNVPRHGDAGLPMGWAMDVSHWRVQTNLRFLTDPILEWASETTLTLLEGGAFPIETIETSPLVDLLLAPQPVLDPRDDENRVRRLRNGQLVDLRQPYRLRENIGFRVEIKYAPEILTKHLMNYLIEHAIDLKHESSDALIGDKLRRPRLTCWVHLQGALVRGNI